MRVAPSTELPAVLAANDSHEENGTPELLVKRVGFAPANNPINP